MNAHTHINTHTRTHTLIWIQLTRPVGSLLDRWHLHTGGEGTQMGFESERGGVQGWWGGGESINRIVQEAGRAK